MKTWKLVSGILSVVLFLFVTMQSCAVGLGNTLEENGESSGSMGLFVAFMLLAGGIISIVSRNLETRGSDIAMIVVYGLGALIGLTMAGNYEDLTIWGGWCLICAVLAFVDMYKKPKTIDSTATQQSGEPAQPNGSNPGLCPKCGKKLLKGAAFCQECGYKIETNQN